jgi:hypothetical protein
MVLYMVFTLKPFRKNEEIYFWTLFLEGKREGKHGRKDPWPLVQSDSEENGEAEEEAKPSRHICKLTPNHHGKCYPNLIKWDPNQFIKRYSIVITIILSPFASLRSSTRSAF